MTRSIEAAGIRWWLGAGASPALLTGALPRILGALERGELANEKAGRRKELYRVRLASGPGPPDALLKVNRYRGGTPWRRQGRLSKARHELRMAEAIARRGVSTPVPLVAGEQRRRGRLLGCYLIVPLVVGATDLRALWFESTLTPSQRRALAEGFGRFSRQVCDAGIFQDDFAPNNFLVVQDAAPQFLMIDFERARLRSASLRRVRFMLAKIDREMLGASAADRMRFLGVFCGEQSTDARGWWQRVRAYAPRLAHRDLRRLTRTATTDGRRFRVVAEDGWSGWAHRNASRELLDRAREAVETPRAGFALERRGDDWRVAYSGLSRRKAAALWSVGRWLYARGLGLEPRVLWWRNGLAVMVLTAAAPTFSFSAAPRGPEGRAALRVFLDRVLTLGRLHANLEQNAMVWVEEPGGLRPRLVAPHVLKVTGRGEPDGRSLSASLADRLLDT